MVNGSAARSASRSPPAAYSRRSSANSSLMAPTLDRGAECASAATEARGSPMTERPTVHHGLEGVVAFESEIAEPDKEGSALRYRGVDIEELAGRVPFENVWGLLVDGSYDPGLPPAEPYNIATHTGD